ncbi:hypothetical protein EIO_2383 [Ketogulonicigenium vulgare Y25]|nr:hypothetical protein EIO_2383 [Ketogulonicigenium vulgare Y25]AOZ55507.1 hypothetical protein KVC_2505 [Ketogulonicigenium vulgare]
MVARGRRTNPLSANIESALLDHFILLNWRTIAKYPCSGRWLPFGQKLYSITR